MSKKLIIVLVLVGFLILGMMGAGFLIIWTKVSSMPAGGGPPAAANGADPAAAEGESIGVTRPLDTFIVNLAEEGGNRYLRVTMELELSTEALGAEIDRRLPQVRDSLLMILPTRKVAELGTVEGKTALREEIIDRLNEFLTTGEITNIYFTEFVIQ